MTDTFEPVAAPKPLELRITYRVHDATAAARYLTATRVGAFDAHEAAKSTRFEDRYVDTDDGAMALAGYAVRLRQGRAGTTASVRTLGHPDDLDGSGGAGMGAGRTELDGPADPTAPPSDWPTSTARSLILEHAGPTPLVELVTLRQVRQRRQIRDAGTRIELSLDEVTVVAGGRDAGRFTVLEANLRRGGDSRLAELAALLDADPALSRATERKMETALAVLAAPNSAGEVEILVSNDATDVLDEEAAQLESAADDAEAVADTQDPRGRRRRRRRSRRRRRRP